MTSVLWPRSANFIAVAHDVTVLPVPPLPVYIIRRNATNWQDENKKGVERGTENFPQMTPLF
jgi:hypothetical protein